MRKRIDCLAVRLCTAFLFLFLSTALFAQKRVTGTVIGSKTNLPVNGASVLVKGTTVGVTTGTDGTFSINVPAGKNTLVISSVGFSDQEADVSSKDNLSITLQENTSSLEEIVVTGYTSQKKKDITGAVAVVNVTNLKSVPAGTSESLLQGQAAGVTVINSGAPGAGSQIKVRGITSIGGNSAPLILVDGVQGSLLDLNSNDIESIQVLKDAGAAAIYGLQGSNGVVVVTTKRGRGPARITYDAFVGTQRPLKDGFNLANTPQYVDVLYRQAFNSNDTIDNAQFQGTVPTIHDYITPKMADEGDAGTDPASYNINTNQITRANKTGTDWFHEIFKPATFQSHTISAAAGSDKSTYFFSLNYLNQEGTLINTYLRRYQARMNTTFNVKNNIRFGENAYVFYKDNPQITNQNEGNAISMSYRIPPIIPVYDIAGNYAGTKSGGLSNAQNPVAIQQRQKDNKGNNWGVNGNVFGEVDFLKHFTIRSTFGGSFDNYYYYYFTYTGYENAEGNTNPNAFTEGSGYYSLWQWTNTLTYKQIFGKHNVSVLIGTEAKDVYARSMQAGRTKYYTTNPDYWTLNTGDPGTQSNQGAPPYQLALWSQFARLDYSFADKYLISGTIRHDQASVFYPDNNSGTFPSVTAGWRISNEGFMKSVSWINELKLRGGWGELGSISNINPTNAYSLYGSGAGYSYYAIQGQASGANQGFFLNQFGNQQTTFEKDIISNIGLDATILNNKIDFSVEYYKKAVSGLLFRAASQIGDQNGDATLPFVNFGDIQNTGIDASATYHFTKKDFRLDLSANITSYKSKINRFPDNFLYLDAGGARNGNFARNQPGHPIGEFFGYDVVGFFQDYADVAKSPVQSGALPGRFKYRDVDGNDTINSADRTFFGNPNPKFTYGFNIAATYKNFDLSAFFYGSQGNDVINYVRYWTDFPQVFGGNVSKDAVNNSVILVSSQTNQLTNIYDPNATVQNPGAKVPVLEQGASFSNTSVPNSYYKEDGSYFRCKQLQIGYTVPGTVLKRFGIEKFRIYAQAANLFTITKYTGLDPELQGADSNNPNQSFGIDFGNYPSNQKSYYIGVNLTF